MNGYEAIGRLLVARIEHTIIFEKKKDSSKVTLVFMQIDIPVFIGFYLKFLVIHRSLN